MAGILDGIRVIDWTIMQVGPYAGAMLADMGAEVIHVEQPGSGDPVRGLKETWGVSLELPGGRNTFFEEHNRNKRSIALDLKLPEAREVLHRLVSRADVFLTNYRARAVKRLEMDYKTLVQHNPKLIYAQASGFGLKGPEADAASLDLAIMARSGAMMASGEEGSPPVILPIGVGDRIASSYLAYGIVAALYHRERTGEGQQLHVSQLQSLMVLQGNMVMVPMLLGKELPRHNRHHPPRSVLHNYYRCRDGRWIVFSVVRGSNPWPAFCRAVNRPEWETDPRFATEAARQRHREELVALLDQLFATKTFDEWNRILREQADMVFCVANTMSELMEDPQVVANDYKVPWDHPVLGPIRFNCFPVDFEKTPLTYRLPAPELGEHTEDVLARMGGYSAQDLEKLRKAGVFG